MIRVAPQSGGEYFLSVLSTRERRLDASVNNTASMAGCLEMEKDGVRQTPVASHIGTFVLTNILFSLFKMTALEPGTDRLIKRQVSFAVHNFPALEHAVSNSQQPLLIIDLETIVDELEERMKRHGYAKSLIILYVNELQRRLDAELPWPEYVYHGSRRFSPSSPGSFPCRTHGNEKILIRTSHYTRALLQDRTAQRTTVTSILAHFSDTRKTQRCILAY
ncbi:hypothetical protein SISNIDRAFT_490552 [Sistotremastrum niveocremeum HHB9708]|uniref:Uncharacterized protein n=1 Tax=Sistotremastrum niveocremeum HHB9708 TaxID=1314777 RepID=A0A164NTY5_9AGAM|nr:hypothetical protein SISNIDRAFT_490552 [Sistotremastrum niveocremeum HHB9708]